MLRCVLVNLRKVCYKRRFATRSGKVHKYLPTPVKSNLVNRELLPPPTKIDRDTAELLGRLSLLGIENEKAIEILEEAVAFADQILNVDTAKVKPLVTVLEDESLHLRDDVSEVDVQRSELLSCSQVTIENYFVTPLGNIEYFSEEKSFKLPELKDACKE